MKAKPDSVNYPRIDELVCKIDATLKGYTPLEVNAAMQLLLTHFNFQTALRVEKAWLELQASKREQ